ncbi:MAG TPA: nucleotide exchange factor GrpE [Bdellovibrionota bacterium]|nr:nucleotide exchange factor GrpE [Bdellovibrionota bacterium]
MVAKETEREKEPPKKEAALKETKKEEKVQEKDENKDLHKKIEELNNKLLYLHAEFENFKKRNLKEKHDFQKYSNESILKSLLSIVDHLEKACEHETENTASIVLGVKMTLKELNNLLHRYGVCEIESVGKPFDPHMHEAVSQETTDKVKPNHVVKQYQKGYVYKDRLLRPARVVVSQEVVNKQGQ